MHAATPWPWEQVHPRPTARVGIGATIPNIGSATVPGALNTVVSAMVAELVSDGLHVFFVDDNSVLSQPPNADYQADNIHPALSGATKISNAWVSAYVP